MEYSKVTSPLRPSIVSMLAALITVRTDSVDDSLTFWTSMTSGLVAKYTATTANTRPHAAIIPHRLHVLRLSLFPAVDCTLVSPLLEGAPVGIEIEEVMLERLVFFNEKIVKDCETYRLCQS